MRVTLLQLGLSFGLLAAPPVALAHEYHADGFTVIHPWAEATAPDASTAPVYFRLENVGKADRLLRARTPHADRVELRGAGADAASTPPSEALDVAPADAIDFVPGRPHLLLRGLKAPLQWGRSYELTLEFERAGPVQVMVSIGAH